MPKGTCLKYGKIYYGWALLEKDSICCGQELQLLTFSEGELVESEGV
jgi:hypothetical protein